MVEENLFLESSPSELIRRSLIGDAVAYKKFLEWVLDYTRMISRKRFQQWNIHSYELIDDFVQEVLLTVHRKRHTYSTGRPVEPWVAGIIRFKSIDYLRGAIRQKRLVPESELDQIPLEPQQEMDHASVQVDLANSLSNLSEKQRKILTMAKLEGLSLQEIALKTGTSESSVKVIIHRAIKALKSRFGGDSIR